MKVKCTDCGEPYEPTHDDTAPGPTVRHMFRSPLRENEIKDLAHAIFLCMIDQRTSDSFGTFYAWLSDEAPGITRVGAASNMWRYVHAQTGMPYADGTFETPIQAGDQR